MNFLRYLIRVIRDYFKKDSNTALSNPYRYAEFNSDGNSNDQNHTPIETNSQVAPVPGTCTQYIEKQESICQYSQGGLINRSLTKGIRLGDGDSISDPESVDKIGQCPFCMMEASQLLNQGAVDLEQAESMSFYRLEGGSQCQLCHRNICPRHTTEFGTSEGKILRLCPECLRQAQQEKFFNKTISVMLSPFIDYKQLSEGDDNHE